MLKKLIWVVLIIALVPSAWYLVDLPDTSTLVKANPTTSAIRKFREEEARQKGKKPHSSMEWRNLDQISPYLWHAVVLAEDDSFFQHNGFDFPQMKNAARTNWRRKKFAFGASTLTQQLARTLYLSPKKNLLRKLKEALITRRLEKSLTKRRILELYLNTVEWGREIYGAEAASEFYFNKPASDLSPEEGIALASILPSPRKWDPHKEEGFMGRRKEILYQRMVRANYIAPPENVELPSTVGLEPLPEPPPGEETPDEK